MTYGCFFKPTYVLIRYTNDLQTIQLTTREIYTRRNVIKIVNPLIFGVFFIWMIMKIDKYMTRKTIQAEK